MLDDFLNFAVGNSDWYKEESPKLGLSSFPVLEKKDLVENLEKIVTISKRSGIVNMTGGTTGASLKVFYTKEDLQARHAMLDNFREEFGYSLGNKVAWFSGKEIVTSRDLDKGIVFRDDYINKIRFFSTFYIVESHFESYWQAFCDFAPEFIVGFPSSIYDLCLMANLRGYCFPNTVKVFFPTAETLLPVQRDLIGKVFGCRLVDQYASSEGAPFILECSSGNMHIHPMSGVFEVVDDDLNPAQEGELLVTSFTTHGTPLIRYRIGDRIKMSDYNKVGCACGSVFPMVDYIEGRSSDYVFSPENGRVNLGNISNSTKNVPGIICFQIFQEFEDEILVKLVVTEEFSNSDKLTFDRSLRTRLGVSMKIEYRLVDSIPREKSGKFRIVKNFL
jgi:phenylacetate-CoA ligase